MPVAKLDNAPRCQHTKLNGAPCAAPARRGRNYCVFHDAAHAKQPDDTLRMVEDAMSLQYALFQVMRLLTDKAVDTKRVALMLYALQIAASNLKRLHEETREIANSGDMAQEKSLMKEFLEVLHLPEAEAERLADEMAVEEERRNGSAVTHTIQACASGPPNRPRLMSTSHRVDINACLAATTTRVRTISPAPNFIERVVTFVPFGVEMPVNASKNPCYYTFSSLR